MGFQAPPNLPDYSKLTFLLNSSGVQKWNPDVYSILKQLIAAVQQSQDVISTNIDSIPSDGLLTVSVDPAGALSGDGTSGSPLAVKVDGSTITINGSDKLAATLGSTIVTASVNISSALGTGGTTLNLIPGVAGVLLIPIRLGIYIGTVSHASDNTITGAYKFTGTTQDAYDGGTLLSTLVNHSRYSTFNAAAFNIQSAVELLGLGIDLITTGGPDTSLSTTHALAIVTYVPVTP